MDLYKTKFILETSNVSEVNKYLQKGWKLIKIYTVSHDPELFPNHLTPHYILAATDNVDYSKDLDELIANSERFKNCSINVSDL